MYGCLSAGGRREIWRVQRSDLTFNLAYGPEELRPSIASPAALCRQDPGREAEHAHFISQ